MEQVSILWREPLYETFVVIVDGENGFKLSGPLHGSIPLVSVNGMLLTPNTDYTIEDGRLFFNFMTKTGDEVQVRYV